MFIIYAFQIDEHQCLMIVLYYTDSSEFVLGQSHHLTNLCYNTGGLFTGKIRRNGM